MSEELLTQIGGISTKWLSLKQEKQTSSYQRHELLAFSNSTKAVLKQRRRDITAKDRKQFLC